MRLPHWGSPKIVGIPDGDRFARVTLAIRARDLGDSRAGSPHAAGLHAAGARQPPTHAGRHGPARLRARLAAFECIKGNGVGDALYQDCFTKMETYFKDLDNTRQLFRPLC
jgi:hypothetical protein